MRKYVERSSASGPIYHGRWFSEREWTGRFHAGETCPGAVIDSTKIGRGPFGITSWSKDPVRTASYGSGGDYFVRYEVEGEIQGAADVSGISFYPEEQEILVATTRFVVVSAESTGGGSWRIRLRQEEVR